MSTTPQESRPRKPREDGLRSRATILDAAARLATVEGLEGLSIGRLAEHIGMSKSGLYAHFGSKEELQLATIETASEIFQEHVVGPTESVESPLERRSRRCARRSSTTSSGASSRAAVSSPRPRRSSTPTRGR